MGADIHAVVEVDYTSDHFVAPTGLAYLEWPRNTEFFKGLGAYDSASLVPQRGFPDRCSLMTARHYLVTICPDGTLSELNLADAIEKSEAEECLATGESHTVSFVESGTGGISNPDFSWPNWITFEEFETILDVFKSQEPDVRRQCEAAIAIMNEMRRQNLPVRLVYWFDV